jgi:hypothetical protein
MESGHPAMAKIAEAIQRMHEPVAHVGEWLKRVLNSFLRRDDPDALYAILIRQCSPTNLGDRRESGTWFPLLSFRRSPTMIF